jgi:hypothetical protein
MPALVARWVVTLALRDLAAGRTVAAGAKLAWLFRRPWQVSSC